MVELKINHGGITLTASYSPGDESTLVVLHGASDGARNSPRYSHLHTLLPPTGIGVVTFDRRGEGDSTGEPSRDRFELQAEDALAVVRAIDAKRIGLWGFSQGGWIAPLVAAATDEVAFLVLVASTGVTPAEQMLYAVERQLKLSGYGDDVVDRALGLRRQFDDSVHTQGHQRDEQLATELRAALDEPWWPHVWLSPTLLDEESQRLWIEEMDFDPRPTFARVRVPTLLFYGEADSWTPVDSSITAWREARGDEVEIVVIPEAEHDLTLPNGTLSPDYEQKLVNWLAHQRT